MDEGSRRSEAAAPVRQTVRISDVAKAAGVSKALVSYALNDRPGVRESTRAHIVETARTMGWTPSLRGRSLSTSRAYAVGLVFESSPEALASDQYYTSLMAGLQSVLSTSKYSLVTEVVDRPTAEREAYQRLARDGRVDGMVIVDLKADDPRFDLVSEAGLAYVSLGRPQQSTVMPVLVYDETTAIRDVVTHLIGLGHTRVAQICGPQSHTPARLRRELYERLFREQGVSDLPWIESDYTAAGGRAATARLLERDPRPTAIVFSNDMMAIAGMSSAFARGLRIPEDLSIVGWDDIAVSQYLHPALSTVTQHPFDDGRMAAELLLQAIEGGEFDQTIPTADPQFVLRESSGPAGT